MTGSRLVLGGFLAVFLASALSVAAEDSPEAMYVGAIVCKTCHGPGQASDSFTMWSVSAHSRTYVQLGTGYVEMIDPLAKGLVPEGFGGSIVREAKRLGVDTDCMQCHTTASDVDDSRKAETFHLEDGVQCEACHGPGGDHVAWIEANGPEPADHRPPATRMRVDTIDDCQKTCHRAKPTHDPFMAADFDPAGAWAKIDH